MNMNPYSQLITETLQQRSSPDKAAWWNRYMKGSIPFLGAGIPEIRNYLRELNRKKGLEDLPMNRQVGLVKQLIRGTYAEEKLAAVLYIQLFWLGKQRNSFILDLLSDGFEDRLVFDWNTSDWLSVRILSPLIDTGEEEVLWKLKIWNRNSYLWKARASLVPFALVRGITAYRKEITRMADMLIRRRERFAKTAVAWVLREYSREDPQFVLDFLSRHVKHTTSEVKRNALKYYREELKKP
ncbi:MAG: DNA alkylation repair protein [Bacteroidales bacterium]